MEPLFEEHLKLTSLSSIAPQVWGKVLHLISANEHTTNTEWVLCMYLALVHRSPHMSCVLMCMFIRQVRRTILSMHKIASRARRTKRMVMNQKRWCSALDEWVMNDNKQQRINHFSVRSSCILHVFTRCDRAFNSEQFSPEKIIPAFWPIP